MKNRTRTILAVVAILVTLFFIFRMKEMYKGEAGPSAGPTPEEEVEEDPEIKKKVEEKGITQEDLDALAGLI
jgi:Na+/H+ antiporter NhaC